MPPSVLHRRDLPLVPLSFFLACVVPPGGGIHVQGPARLKGYVALIIGGCREQNPEQLRRSGAHKQAWHGSRETHAARGLAWHGEGFGQRMPPPTHSHSRRRASQRLNPGCHLPARILSSGCPAAPDHLPLVAAAAAARAPGRGTASAAGGAGGGPRRRCPGRLLRWALLAVVWQAAGRQTRGAGACCRSKVWWGGLQPLAVPAECIEERGSDKGVAQRRRQRGASGAGFFHAKASVRLLQGLRRSRRRGHAAVDERQGQEATRPLGRPATGRA